MKNIQFLLSALLLGSLLLVGCEDDNELGYKKTSAEYLQYKADALEAIQSDYVEFCALHDEMLMESQLQAMAYVKQNRSDDKSLSIAKDKYGFFYVNQVGRESFNFYGDTELVKDTVVWDTPEFIRDSCVFILDSVVYVHKDLNILRRLTADSLEVLYGVVDSLVQMSEAMALEFSRKLVSNDTVTYALTTDKDDFYQVHEYTYVKYPYVQVYGSEPEVVWETPDTISAGYTPMPTFEEFYAEKYEEYKAKHPMPKQ